MTAFEFFKRVNFKIKLSILITLFELPAVVYHELCHVIGAILTFSRITKIEVNYFYKVEGEYLKSYEFTVNTNTRGKFVHLRALIINVAPVIGILILLLIDLRFIYWIIASIKTFWLSKVDIENVTYNWKHLKTK